MRISKIIVGAALGALAFGPTAAEASLVVTVLNSTAPAGGTGSFDVLLSSTAGTFGVGGFSVELSVAANSGITFTSVGTATAAPYLFGALQTPPLTFANFPTADFIATDSDAAAPGFVDVAPTGAFGLEHVTYAVAPGTPGGPIAVSIVGMAGLAPTTQINDLVGAPFPFTPINGVIAVTAVPEPPSLALMATPAVAALGLGLARRRLAPVPSR